MDISKEEREVKNKMLDSKIEEIKKEEESKKRLEERKNMEFRNIH
jgi:hypothetical protein